MTPRPLQKSMTETFLRSLILTSLESNFGIYGSSLEFEILSYEQDSQIGVIRVARSGASTLWTSLTFITSHLDDRCSINLLKVSASLTSLCSLRSFSVENFQKV